MASTISLLIRSGISPVERNAQMTSTAPLAETPAARYRGRRSLSRLANAYVLVITGWTQAPPAVKAASRASDCLPDPATPTSSAVPQGVRRTRDMRMKWRSASLNRMRLAA
eukprot:scaffold1202_cov110-Isochrysis_galbana.AAC.6